MRLTVVGCSGSMPGPHSPASCYLLEAEGFRLVVDLGNVDRDGRPASTLPGPGPDG
jgi:ribonuclease BN (tRNA processing enzyme)